MYCFGRAPVANRLLPPRGHAGVEWRKQGRISTRDAEIRVVIRVGERSGNLLLFKRNGASQANHARESSTGNRLDMYTDKLYRLPVYMKY